MSFVLNIVTKTSIILLCAASLSAVPQKTRIGNAGAVPNAVVPPHVIESRPPIYTDEALAARIEGIVTLEAAVDTQGKIAILRVVKSLGYGLDQRATGAVLDWKFVPAIRSGVPVKAIAQIDVEFKLPPAHVFRIGGGVTAPSVISRVEPQYSDEARNARYQGTVVLEVTIKKDGTAEIVRVVRSIGFGLDENAVEAIKQWRFKPGMRNGVPVDVSVNVEVNFNLRQQ